MIIIISFRKSHWKSGEGWNKDRFYDGKNKRNRIQSNRNHHLGRSGTHSFYVTDFPESILPFDMWRVCSQLGKVVDVFISDKNSRMEKHIGFS